jgi:hypothetical protein
MEKHYVIDLPKSFPERLITNLSNVNYANYEIVKKMYFNYEKIPKESSTYAASSIDALGHLFFRSLENQLAKTFLKMFEPKAKEYAFFLEPLERTDFYGKKLSLEEAKNFRAMELAMNIAYFRGGKPKDYLSKARKLISNINEDFQ